MARCADLLMALALLVLSWISPGVRDVVRIVVVVVGICCLIAAY